MAMDNKTITLSSTFLRNLQKTHSSFDEVSKQQFQEIQLQCQRLPSLIYRTTDIELSNGDSEVHFYNLAYVNRNFETSYFKSETVFVVPPTMFLGDKEEMTIVKWLKAEKAAFFTTQRSPRKPRTTIHTPTRTLTQEEEREIQYTTEVFNQLLNGEIYEEDIEDDTELPNFSLGFDFMALCSELPKTSVEL